MIQSLVSIYPYYIFLSVFIVIIAIILFFATMKYNKKRTNLYSLFLNLNLRSIVLLSSCILNLSFILFFSFYIKGFNNLAVYLIVINTFLSLCISLNIHIILFDILYAFVTIACLKLYSLVYIYINEIYYDKNVLILSVLFMIMILIYGLFITMRKTELILRDSRRRIKNAK
ncbi:MAG: hypothetical protein ACI33S_05545 [Bacilli bacterium]|nr:hypothetical protein [bacterium]